MILINADLHIHSRFSMSTSKFMTFETLAVEAPKKGVHLIGSGDCLHPIWFKELSNLDKISDGTFQLNDVKFLATAEVQAEKRVHHLIIFPSLGSVEQFREKTKKKSKNLETDGRPHIHLSGAEIADLAYDVDALFGPCHAFTPWTGVYGHFDDLKACYGEYFNKISLLELGLSADTGYADRIAELKNITFLSNSDAHSPYPVRLAREFNQFKVNEITFDEIKKAIQRTGGRKCTLNAGFPPQEGKYNQSACIKCFKKYSLEESMDNNWKCDCGGRIKKGVAHRIEELATYPTPRHPKHRPKYLHIIPLAEIITKALNYSSINSINVKKIWSTMVTGFGNEIRVLLDADIKEIERLTNRDVAYAIHCFRENKIVLHPGGGGRYGQIEIPKLDS